MHTAVAVIAGTVVTPSPESSSNKAFFGRLIEHVQTMDDMDNFSPIFGVRELPEEDLGHAMLELETGAIDCDHGDKLANLPASVFAANTFAEQYCGHHTGGKTKLKKDHVAAIHLREYL